MRDEILNGTVIITDTNKVEVIESLNQISVSSLSDQQIVNVKKVADQLSIDEQKEYFINIVDNNDHLHDLKSEVTFKFMGLFQDVIDILTVENEADRAKPSESYQHTITKKHIGSNVYEEYCDGKLSKTLYHNMYGKLHREDGPAIESWWDGEINGRTWYKNGKLHRDGNKPAIEYPGGNREYLVDGKYHRTNGPAIAYSGDGYGSLREYYINGEELTYEEFKKVKKNK